MILNQLTINPKKPSILVIQPTLRGSPKEFQLNIDEVCVKSLANVKYLGMNSDQHLNYESQYQKHCKKLPEQPECIEPLYEVALKNFS